jgi:ribonuclease D
MQIGLASICEEILGKRLCKFEQLSTWAMKPYRQSQIHYAVMDAWILIKLMETLEKEAKEKGIDINNEVKEFDFVKN